MNCILKYIVHITLLIATVSAENSTSYRCPPVNQVLQVPASQKITLIRTSSGFLCTLSQITAGSGLAQVARSYDGNDWENVAGLYRTIPINCTQGSCDILIPTVNTSIANFFLASFDRSLPSVDVVARFLEQATFGTTKADIESIRVQSNNFVNLPQTFAHWVYDQMYNTNMTSHREFWRLRMASRQIYEGREGAPTHPCQAKSQWRRASFTEKDSFQIIQTTFSLGRFPLYVNGNLRTVVNQSFFQFHNISINIEQSMNFTLCQDIEDFVGGRLSMKIGHRTDCVTVQNGNPPIDFTPSDPQPRFIIALPDITSGKVIVSRYTMNSSIPENIYVSSNLSSDTCKTIPLMICCNGQGSVFGLMSTGQYMMFDPRLVFRTNSIAAPLYDGGGSTMLSTDNNAQCANVPRTFLNEKKCSMSTVSTACSSSIVPDVSISLSTSTVASFFTATAKQLYIYIVDGLRIDDDLSVRPPCLSGATSRWRRIQTGMCLTNVQTDTATLFQQLISQSSDSNPNVRDINLPSKFYCNALDSRRMSLIIKIGSECWTTTHPDNLNVYDFTYWTLNGTHPGNVGQVGITNPITKFALGGSSTLFYPQSHPMERWQINKNIFPFIGRFNDTIAFSDLPDYLRQNYIALSFGYTSTPVDAGTVVCGSPGEISNNVETFPAFDVTRSPEQDTTSQEDFVQQRKTVWTMIALQSPDQLRQRMAWALSQLFAISPYSDPNTEIYLNYYDIFVRNAFGNYRDVLREVAYSPLMAKMLSYLGSQSQAFTWSSIHELRYADENFAREVMQLFSIGLVKLNSDGTPITDDQGNYIRTYSNDDVMEYSRIWTGFTRQQARGNYEERLGLTNNLDPMTVNVNWRDFWPKMGLNNQYVGDKYMLCSDIPPRSFLRTGATYRLLGSSYIPELSTLKVYARGSSSVKVLELNQTSPLFRKLCGQGNCTAALSVTLDQNLPCYGYECQIDMIQVVKLSGNLFYEFVRPACVNFPFFNTGFMTMNTKGTWLQCVDSRLAVAAELCCSSTNAIYNSCMFSGERVILATAKARCIARSRSLCSGIPLTFPRGNCWNYNGNFWLNKTCGVNILISSEGKIAVELNNTSDFPDEGNTFFRVSWINGSYPSVRGNSCAAGLCSIVGCCLCRCSTFVVEKAAFNRIPSRAESLSQLNVGGVPPAMFDDGTYILKGITSDGVWIYQASNIIDSSTIFKVQDDYGRIMYLRNFQSTVYVGAASGFFVSTSYGFRNPPGFFDAVANKGDALYETEAALDHYFYHENTAPFIATNFIQKFGISNPSPRYIRAVATAFQKGLYTFSEYSNSSITFGNAIYGDLGATVSAVILDRESRSVVLDTDPSQGSLREPLLKVIALMRNLEFKLSNGTAFTVLENLQTKIGQMAHDIPSVFSFFLPQYSPPGLMITSLVSPESMLLTHTLGLMNGMISLVKFGLTSCYDGFGVSKNQECRSNVILSNKTCTGWLSYTPLNGNPKTIIDELATLLTSGRMSTRNRNIIEKSYNASNNSLLVAEQLFLSAPEFHSTGLVRSNDTKRKVGSVSRSCKAYKAVVHILLKGGCDSYNMLVPHSQCQAAQTDLYEEYRNIRGTVALAKESLLPIQADGNTQPCGIFGLHPSLRSLKRLYDDGAALFFANIGGLDRPVSNQNYLQLTTTQLFAHDAMQAEIGRLDPFQSSMGTGFLGRMVDYLYENNYNVNAFSIDAPLSTLAGENTVATKYPVASEDGFRMYNPSSDSDALIEETKLLNDASEDFSSVFAELWSSSLQNTIDSSTNLFWAQKRGNVSTVFPATYVGYQLKLVAEMINSNNCRQSDRDVFYIEVPGYDHHDSLLSSLQSRFDELNDGLTAFVAEMKLRNKWKDVTIVSTSDFGRTLTGNSNEGTDHGWAGNSFVAGGSVRGQRILGQYPSDLSDDSPLSIGRGRLLPTLPWEAVWNAVAEWFDIVNNTALNKIFPNRGIFSSSLFHQHDIFNEAPPDYSSCSRRLTSALTCQQAAESGTSQGETLGTSPSGTPLNPSSGTDSWGISPTGGSTGNGNQTIPSSPHDSKGKTGGNNIARWLVPVSLVIVATVAISFYRRRLSSFLCSKQRSNRSRLEPTVIFFNSIDPNNIEVEAGSTIRRSIE